MNLKVTDSSLLTAKNSNELEKSLMNLKKCIMKVTFIKFTSFHLYLKFDELENC